MHDHRSDNGHGPAAEEKAPIPAWHLGPDTPLGEELAIRRHALEGLEATRPRDEDTDEEAA